MPAVKQPPFSLWATLSLQNQFVCAHAPESSMPVSLLCDTRLGSSAQAAESTGFHLAFVIWVAESMHLITM